MPSCWLTWCAELWQVPLRHAIGGRRMFRTLTAFALVLALLAACSASTPPMVTPLPSQVPAPVPTPTPTSTSTSTPVPATTPTPERSPNLRTETGPLQWIIAERWGFYISDKGNDAHWILRPASWTITNEPAHLRIACNADGNLRISVLWERAAPSETAVSFSLRHRVDSESLTSARISRSSEWTVDRGGRTYFSLEGESVLEDLREGSDLELFWEIDMLALYNISGIDEALGELKCLN